VSTASHVIRRAQSPDTDGARWGNSESGGGAVAYDMRGREGGAQFEGPHDTANMRAASGGSSRSYVQQGWAVRRLTPVECARLQGFADRHSQIPWRGKSADECPDGPQYKTYGNSMAVKCMRWLGERFEMAFKQTRTPAS
jgi:DNA (cytosine-5)-methyltransferase 1